MTRVTPSNRSKQRRGGLPLANEHIDLVFLDIPMPGGMDGIETPKRMKQMSPDTEAQVHGVEHT